MLNIQLQDAETWEKINDLLYDIHSKNMKCTIKSKKNSKRVLTGHQGQRVSDECVLDERS